MSGDYRIQFLDNSGWRTCVTFTALADGAMVMREMQQAQVYYPEFRIRCVDHNDRLIDML
jgi:hypothetical protein